MELLALLFASLWGLCSSLAAVSISYPAHKRQDKGEEMPAWEHWLSFTANLALTALGVGFGFLASKHGAVAVVMPVSVGGALFSNMILQQHLRLARFTNAAITGTLVLVIAIMMLPQLGPSPPKEEVDPVLLLQAPMAIAFIASSLVFCFGSLTLLMLHKVQDDFSQLLLFSIVGGSGNVLNMSIQKMLMSNPPFDVAVILLSSYVVFSILCLGSNALANTLKDPSLFVPLNNAMNIFFNCMAGLFIWRDMDHLEYPWSYFMLYLLVGLGSYLVSSIDAFSIIKLEIQSHRCRVFNPALATRMDVLARECTMIDDDSVMFSGAVNRALLQENPESLTKNRFKAKFPHLHAGMTLLRTDSLQEFEKQFLKELKHQELAEEDVVSLVSLLLVATGGFANNPHLQYWVSTISSDLKRQSARAITWA